MNYLFLNRNFALKGNCRKDDVVTFTAHFNITIMLEGKSMHSNMVANTNHTTLLKNQSAIKYLS